jgi:integrase
MGRIGTGVEVRDSSIRILFILNGEKIKERVTLNGKSLEPTPANIKYATRLAADIKRRIAQGAFDYADFFPDSPRAKIEDAKRSTFGDLADLWLKSKGRLEEATKDQYGTAVRFWKKLLGADKVLADINHKTLAAEIGGYPWPSAKTHNNYLIALRGTFNLEYRGAAALNNPLSGIENMPIVKKLPDPLTLEERDRILADLASHYDARVYAYFLWMFYTGMRPEEAIALRWSDIDWKREIVRVQRVRTFKGSERDGSKTNKERDVDLLPQALDALQLMKPHTFMQKTERRGDDTAADIFVNPVTGRAWHDERSQRDNYWRPALKRLGIRWRKAYNTRHTFATMALMLGAPPSYIADQLGHSVQMLLEKYARWVPGNDKGNARAMLAAAVNSSQIVPNSKTGSI